METGNVKEKKINHGLNIKRTRMRRNIKQEKLASLLELSQQTVSRYENMEEIEDDMLKRFAKALEVPLEDLKVEEGDAPTIFVENNTVTNSDKSVANLGGFGYNSDLDNTTINPLDKIVELYERLLKEEKDRNDSFEKRLLALEQKPENK